MILPKFLLPAAMPVILFLLISPTGPTASIEDEIEAIGRRLDHGDVAGNWDIVAEIGEKGQGVAPALEKALPTAGERARLGFATALIDLDRKDVGIAEVKKLIFEAKEVEVRRAAARILALRGEVPDIRPLSKTLSRISDEYVKISVARALANYPIMDRGATTVLLEFLDHGEFSVRCEAAIALAEIGDYDSGIALLEQIRFEPTTRGRIADRLLQQKRIEDAAGEVLGLSEKPLIKMLRADKERLEEEIRELRERGPGDPLIEELIQKIEAYHVDGEIAREALLDAAAHGMVSGMVLDPPLDKFSAFFNEKETTKFMEGISGVYAGIGAIVSVDPDTKFLTIVKPFVTGPAYREGLRSNDTVLEVKGISTYNRLVGDMVDEIRGDPGTPVTLLVNRRGWPAPREITIVRENIELPIVHGEIMPGEIGYVRLMHFGELADRKLGEILDTLEDSNMQGLVLDLRGNPGGLLEQARRVAGMFMRDRRIIVSSKGRNEVFYPPEEHYGGGERDARPDYPLVILVDGRSASASEIVAGALQDYARATLIGQKTYGKGSVQRPIRLDSTKEQDMLKLTVAEYFLPSGRSIHREGVAPDILIKRDSMRDIHEREWIRLTEMKAFEEYIAKNYPGNEELFAELAEYDGGDPSRYPGFEEWYASLETSLSRDDVRYILRGLYVREKVVEERGAEFPTDLQDDIQLQRAIAEVLDQTDRGYRDFAEYDFFPDEFPEEHPEAETH